MTHESSQLPQLRKQVCPPSISPRWGVFLDAHELLWMWEACQLYLEIPSKEPDVLSDGFRQAPTIQEGGGEGWGSLWSCPWGMAWEKVCLGNQGLSAAQLWGVKQDRSQFFWVCLRAINMGMWWDIAQSGDVPCLSFFGMTPLWSPAALPARVTAGAGWVFRSPLPEREPTSGW